MSVSSLSPSSHPNAVVGGILGAGGIGQGIVALLTNQGVHLSASNAAWVAAAAGTAVLFLGGAIKYVWAHGTSGTLSRVKDGAPPPPAGGSDVPPPAK